MKKIIFLLLICNVCNAQYYSRFEDHNYYNKKYKGHIKQVINSYYSNYYFDSGKLKKNDTIQNAGFKLISSRKDSFNNLGNIQKLTYIPIDTTDLWTIDYSYDISNKLVGVFRRNLNSNYTTHRIFNYNNGRLEQGKRI